MGSRHDTSGGLEGLAETWFLRTGEDAVYGELTLPALSDWAEKGRILAHHEVSRNGTDWVKAETVQELKMDWYVLLKSGASQGPLNLLCLPDLLYRGMIDPSAVLRNKLTNREISAASILRGAKDPSTGSTPRPPVRKARIRTATGADEREEPAKDQVRNGAVAMPARPVLRASGAPPTRAKPTDDEAETVIAPDVARAAVYRDRIAADTGGLEEDLRRDRAELKEHKDRIGELLKQLADETALHEQLRARHTREALDIQEKLAEKARLIEERNKALGDLRTRCAELEMEKGNLAEKALETAGVEGSRLAALEKALREERAAHEALQASIPDKDASHRSALASLAAAGAAASSEIQDLKAQLAKLVIEKETLDQKLGIRAGEAADLRPRVAQLTKDAEALRQENAALKQESGKRSEENGRLGAELERAKEMQARLEKSLAELRSENERLANEKTELTSAARRQTDDTRKLQREKEHLEREKQTVLQEKARLEQKDAERTLEFAALSKAVETPAPVEEEWYLRLDGGKVYGPVGLRDLYAWAADCRVGPGQQVSQDKIRWQQVEDIAALRMDWKIKLVDGNAYGPLNAFAVPQLVRDGATALESTLVHKSTGKEESLENVLIGEAGMLLKQESEHREQSRRKDQLLAGMREKLTALQQQLSERPSPALPPKQARALISPPKSLKSMLLGRNRSGT